MTIVNIIDRRRGTLLSFEYLTKCYGFLLIFCGGDLNWRKGAIRSVQARKSEEAQKGKAIGAGKAGKALFEFGKISKILYEEVKSSLLSTRGPPL
jgi:hypothetical protein